MDDYISKPVMLQDLSSAIEEWLIRKPDYATPGMPVVSFITYVL
jgi:hypothetical protein